jgi:CheY-like chemotaxis protein
MPRGEDDRPSVVVVEDEIELAELYRGYLQPEFDVEVATSGGEALELIDGDTDVALLDRRLPETDGETLLAELRTRGYDLPVAMVTAVEPDVDVVELPFDEYLTKPIDRETLLTTTNLLARRASFDRTSRDFFRLVSKKASLEASDATDREGGDHDALIDRMQELQSVLDETIERALENGATRPSRSAFDPDDPEALLTEIYEHSLPPELAELIEAYQHLQDARPPFMWKWVHRLAPRNTLPCVEQRFREAVPVDKTIAILFVTLLDDVFEKRRDRATFAELSKIPTERQAADPTAVGVDTEYVSFARRVWETLIERIRRGPNYDTYEELFRFDIGQAITSIEYSDIAIRRPDLATMGDLERYESHNMAMFAYADIDLMHSPIAVRDELSTLREAIWTAQLMARIGNWVSTWERELREGDYSSGVVVSALKDGIVSRNELAEIDGSDPPEATSALIDRIKERGVEKRLLMRWELNYHQLRSYDEELTTVDLGSFIDGTEDVLRYHLASTGLK